MAQKSKTAAKKSAAGKKSQNKKRNEKQTAKKDVRSGFFAYFAVTAIIAILLGIFMYTGGDAIVSTFVRNALYSLFGVPAYIIPAALAAEAIYLCAAKSVSGFWKKTALIFCALSALSAIVQLATAADLTSIASSYGNGGFIGAAIAVTLCRLVQKIASFVLLIIALIALIGAIVGLSALRDLNTLLKRFGNWVYDTYCTVRESYYYEEKYDGDHDEQALPDSKEKKTSSDSKRSNTASMLDDASSFANDTLKTSKKNKKPSSTADNADDFDNVFDNDFDNIFDSSNGIDEVFGNIPDNASENVSGNVVVSDSKPAVKASDEAAEKREKASSDTGKKKITAAEKEEFNNEFDEAIEQEIKPYVFPTIDLLSKPSDANRDNRAELRNTAEKLIEVLETFGVKAKLLQVTQGPAVTRYEIQPDVGIKFSKVSGLAGDIALHLAVSTVLVAPVPGKAAIGIEIPNNKVSAVSIREMLSSDEFITAKSKLTFALGKDIGGSVVVGDIAKMPHLLIAGETGSGKSVCINTIIMSILYKASPQEVKLIMIDPKVVELGVYNGIPHLLVPVVTDAKKAAGALNWAVSEMMRRYDLFKETGVRKLEAYNKLMESTGGETVPQLVIIIDELADLMMVAAKEVEDYVCRIAQLARAAGIHLIIATQRPSVDVITGLIKANIPSRIAFSVTSQVDSRTILDKAGAEKLLGMGDMLYHPTGARGDRRIQGAFVSDADIERVLAFIKENYGEENHYSEDLEEQIERVSAGENGVTPDTEDDGDALLPDAIALAVRQGKISTSQIQRSLRVGYARAGRIIDQMEARGIISAANGSKPRDVLVSHADVQMSVDDDDMYDDDYDED